VLRYEALTNVAPAPRTSFAVDGVELAAADGRARDAGLRLLGLCHTHPDGRPTPSATDEAADWPGSSCWIAATDGGDRFTLAEFELRSARLQGPGRAEPDQKRNV
jgi:proteasome lid subunit RPN8/RPN11